MPTLLQTVILSAVEGVTEFLPISSTAHLTLAATLLGLVQSEFMKSFEIIIQLGAIGAVVALYWRKLLDLEILKRLFVAFLPTGILGLTLYKIIKQYLLGNTAVTLWSLFLGGLFLVVFERMRRGRADGLEDLKRLPYGKCLGIGLFQSLAMVPGVSRSAATIVGGLILGLKREAIVEFSFLLAVPTMAAATGLDLLKSAGSFSVSQAGTLAIGLLLSFATAVFAIRFLLNYVRRHDFTAFGIYRMAIVLAFLA